MNATPVRRRAAYVSLVVAGLLSWPATNAAAQPKPFAVQVGVPVPNIAALQLYVAQQAGYFKEEGLDVEVRYSTGAPQALQLVAAGQADVAMGTVEPLISGYERGLRAKAVLRTHREMIYYVAVPAESGIRQVSDLKGAKVGVASLAGAAASVTRSTLRAGGVEVTADTLQPVGIGEQALAALTSGRVQALGLWSNAYYALERNGTRFRYFKHPTLGAFGNGAVMTSERVLTGRRPELCGFGRAIAKATVFMNENPSAALRMYWTAVPSARAGKIEAEAVRTGMVELAPQVRDFDVGFPPSERYGAFDKAAFTRYEVLLKEQGMNESVPPVDELVSDAIVGCVNQFDATKVRQQAAASNR